jgi:DNA-binding beta-propeller fold protein YncE
MKPSWILTAISVLAWSGLTFAQAQKAMESTSRPKNPLPYWYRASETARYSVGKGPMGLAFDGANLWSANYGDGTVTKLRAKDGRVLGTFAVGRSPAGVTFDGANIWVSNSADSTVTKLRASDGRALGTFTVPGVLPWWMAFDGANVWVPSASTKGKGWVTKLRTSDGKNLGSFMLGVGPIAAAFD